MRYFRQKELGKPEEIQWGDLIKGVQSEFMFGEHYYEHMFVLLGMGQKLVGSQYMYWIEKT